jgi:hypothetical protein
MECLLCHCNKLMKLRRLFCGHYLDEDCLRGLVVN